MSEVIVFAGGGTGGHVFPMIAVADALRELSPELRSVFVGTARGMEVKAVPSRGYELELMDVLPLRGSGVGGTLRGLARAASAMGEARALVRRLAPRALFSTGGYAAGPITLAARLAGVPVALLEPNAVMGLSNRLVAPLVKRAYLAFPEPERHVSGGRARRFGVPLRAGFTPRETHPGGLRHVLVIGGSQGARSLNEAVPTALARLSTHPIIVHQCGSADEVAVRERYHALGLANRATVTPFIDDMPAALAAANLVVSRSGASAVSEICAVGRASLLVPYPFAAGNHQVENARSLERAGAAICIEHHEATPERLALELERLVVEPLRLDGMAHAARALGHPDAARRTALDLLDLAGLAPSSPGAGAAQHAEAP